MKSENLFSAIGNVSDKYIEEATPKNRDNKVTARAMDRKSNKRLIWIVTATAVIFAVSIALATMLPNIIDSSKTTNAVKYNSSDNLQKISCSFIAEGMGGGSNFGHLIVKDYSETISENPTLDNVDGITGLPVFENEKGLWSDYYYDLDSINDLIYFKNPTYETTYDYSYYGEVGNTWNLCYQYNAKKGIVDQLLDYSFHRIFYTSYYHTQTDVSWARVLRPPSAPGILYPIISLSEAETKLRNGDFFCYGDEKSVASTADILSVEIVYDIPMAEEYNISYLQPYYLFYITDKSWDLSFIMECENKEEFISVSPIYIPALQEEYLEITEPNIFFN